MMSQTKNSQKWPIALFTIGVFMAGLDNGIISTALTTIYESFHVSPSWGAWSITLYTLGIAISVPIIGKLSDNYGRRRLFIIEIFLFGLGSLLVALSPNFTFLLIARFIQAIGGGGIFIIGTSHILATLPEKSQGKALGLLGGMHGLSAVIGPNLGGVIIAITGTWQWMFLINIPIAIFLIVFGYLKIGETKSGEASPLDVTGTFLLSFAILFFMFGITNIDSSNFGLSLSNKLVTPFIIGGILLFIILLLHERQVEASGRDPIFAYSLLKDKQYRLVLCLALLSGGFLAGIIFIPSYLQQVFHLPVEQAGFWLTPLAIASGIGSGLGGFLTDRVGSVKALIYSGVIGITGFLLYPLFVTNLFTFTLASLFAGIGLGILLGAPLNVLVGQRAKKEQYGSALATLSLVRQIGLTLFPTVYAGFITASVTRVEPTLRHTYGEETAEAFHQLGNETSESYSSIMEEIEKIDEPMLRNEIYATVTNIFKAGFNNMFLTTATLSFIVLLIGVYLLFNNRKRSL